MNSLSVSDLTREHSRKCEGRKGIQKLELGQNIRHKHLDAVLGKLTTAGFTIDIDKRKV
jgi:hypothetical protein